MYETIVNDYIPLLPGRNGVEGWSEWAGGVVGMGRRGGRNGQEGWSEWGGGVVGMGRRGGRNGQEGWSEWAGGVVGMGRRGARNGLEGWSEGWSDHLSAGSYLAKLVDEDD